MRRHGSGWLYSPRDVLAVLECEHRLALERAVAHRLMPPPEQRVDAALALVSGLGETHEQALLEREIERFGDAVVQIPSPGGAPGALEEAADATVAALEAGAPVIYQAVLLVDGFLGYADFLVTHDPLTGELLLDDEGRVVHEPVDAKLARSARPAALLQVACYGDALVRLGRPVPRHVHLWLGDGTREAVPAADVMPLAAEYRTRVLELLGAEPHRPDPVWGDARPACETCRWSDHCDGGRRDARDLSLVAGMRRDQVTRLRAQGLTTIDRLAAASSAERPARMARDTFDRLRDQASLQVAGEAGHSMVWQVRDAVGLGLLPPPDAGDLYYDIEGDPFAEGGEGLEYLHGLVDTGERSTAFWGHDRAGEKEAFERLVDAVVATTRAHPGAHVYHYAAYERSALTRLAARHATREHEVDTLLREGRLVDLYAVVRRSVLVSTESYSIKKLEPLYMGDDLRVGDVQTAGDSIVQYEQAIAHRAAGRDAEATALLDDIADYNCYDCRSTHRLHGWLLSLRTGADDGASQAVEALQARQPSDAEIAADRLRATVPADAADRDGTQHAVALLAAAIGYHARNSKTFWWEHFDRLRRPVADLVDDDGVVVLDDVVAGPFTVPGGKRNLHRTLVASTGSARDDVERLGTTPMIVYGPPLPDGVTQSADSDRGYHSGVVDLSWVDASTPPQVRVVERAPKGSVVHDERPVALFPSSPPSTAPLESVLMELGDGAATGLPTAAWSDLLLRALPRSASGRPLPRSGDDLADITAALRDLDRSVLAVQGPPGTGKTYVASHVIVALARAGWRIGVTAQSHAAIEHLLAKVCELADDVAVAKEQRGKGGATAPWLAPAKLEEWLAQQVGGCVVGGTAWNFARPGVRAQTFDLVVVDEAGQLSLPDAVVAGSAAERLLLLGDPQQLPQVSQGSHPEPVDVSALGHLLGEHAVIEPERGYFLATSHRMHPAVCAPVSMLQYEGRLRSDEKCSRRRLEGVAAGVHLVEVDHSENRTSSDEEVAAVVSLVAETLGRDWTDEHGAVAPLGQDGVLVVAPFNRQVASLRRALRENGYGDVLVGTVDKFQGREAPVVIVSMATSSGDDLPRGVEFLLSRNRLNVALSRAQWAVHLVHSPALRRILPTSTAGVRALGAFLGVLHGAEHGAGLAAPRIGLPRD